MKAGDWSSLLSQKDGGLCFFQLLERKQSSESLTSETTDAQQSLVLDAQKKLMNQLLDILQEKKLITLKNETE